MVCLKEQEITESDSLVERCSNLLKEVNNVKGNILGEYNLLIKYIFLRSTIKNYIIEKYRCFLKFVPNYNHWSLDYYLSQYPIKKEESSLSEIYPILKNRLSRFELFRFI